MPASTAVKAAKTARSKKAPKDNSEIPELHGRIALRAYQIFEERGRKPGHSMEDWLKAEQEVLSERIDTDLG
jgi:Protein of unknown function (DUF2934)